MTVPINTEEPDPESLRWAIEQIQRELPDLLGSAYSTFSTALELLLPKGSNDELLALFASHPVAYYRLQVYFNQFNAGHGLYGDSISTKSNVSYLCPTGHLVDGADVQKRDVAGRPLCPTHGRAMRLAPQ